MSHLIVKYDHKVDIRARESPQAILAAPCCNNRNFAIESLRVLLFALVHKYIFDALNHLVPRLKVFSTAQLLIICFPHNELNLLKNPEAIWGVKAIQSVEHMSASY